MSKSKDCACSDMANVVAVILAGGKGSRLKRLTMDQPKPGVPFAGKYRLIDFPLFNAVNSQIPWILILTEYGQYPIQQHVQRLNLPVPAEVLGPQFLYGHQRYIGTANAVYQNAGLLRAEEHVEHVLILSGDHIYKQDYRVMQGQHVDHNADFTIAGFWVTPEEAPNFGIMDLDDDGRVVSFTEKPKEPKVASNGMCFASMGIYLSKKDFLLEKLTEDSLLSNTENDFGKDVIPAMIDQNGASIYAYDFRSHTIKGEEESYWADVGRLNELLRASVDLTEDTPEINLYNKAWTIKTRGDNKPPAKWVGLENTEDVRPDWVQKPLKCIMSGGCVFDWPSNFDGVTFSRDVYGGRFNEITDSYIYDNVILGRNIKMRHTFVMEDTEIGDGIELGFNLEKDEKVRCFNKTTGVEERLTIEKDNLYKGEHHVIIVPPNCIVK